MSRPPASALHRVVVAGAGIAGLEAMMALAEVAGDRVATTLVAPDDRYTVRALSVREPFAAPGSAHWPVGRICADHGATYLRGTVAEVEPDARRVRLADGTFLGYDSLLVAVGATARPAFNGVATFRGAHDAEVVHGVVQDVEDGYTKRVAFVVPRGTTWPLPLYELALMLAERGRSAGHDDLQITFVTAERQPLAVLGASASQAVRDTLAGARIDLRTGYDVASVRAGRVVATPDLLLVEAQRVLSAPLLSGPATPGLPTDADGFVLVDPYGRVPGRPGVFAAGDGATVPIKQGGLAAAEGAAAALTIASDAGAAVVPKAFEPALQAQLLTGDGVLRLEGTVPWLTTRDDSTASQQGLLWPPSKIVAPRLNAWMEANSALAGAR